MTSPAWSPTDHRPSLVLELVHRDHAGWFCLACSHPWPCPDAPEAHDD